MRTKTAIEKRVLTLKAGEDGKSTLYYLSKGNVIQFRKGPTLFGCDIRLVTNYPTEEGSSYERNVFRDLKWSYDSANSKDDTAAYVEIVLDVAGTFDYAILGTR